MTLEEMAVLEAAERGLTAARRKGKFDPKIFEAVADYQLRQLNKEINTDD